MRRSAVVVAVLALFALFARSAMARADAVATRRARIAGAIDDSLAARVRGQTADLAWAIVFDTTAPGEAPADDNLDALVWFERDTSTLAVLVSDPRARRVLRAELDVGDDPSALDESAALVVRSALEALELGPIGVPVTPPESSESPTERGDPAIGGAPISVPTGWLAASIGAFSGVDGVGVPRGIAMELTLRLSVFVIGITGRVGLLERSEGERVAIELAQHRVAISAGWVAIEDPIARLAISLDVGARLVTRTTVAVSAELEATPPSLLALPSVGLAARGSLWPITDFGVFVDLGAELSPVLEHRVSDTLAFAAWPVTLRGILGVTLEIPVIQGVIQEVREPIDEFDTDPRPETP